MFLEYFWTIAIETVSQNALYEDVIKRAIEIP